MYHAGIVKGRRLGGLSRTQRLVIQHAFYSFASFLYSFHFILNITQLDIFYTQRATVIWVLCKVFGRELLEPVFKTSQFRHTQANFVTCYWDQKHFHSLLTSGNIASNRKGVPFIIRRSDTDKVLGEGGQRSQDSGCCSTRNLYLQWRSCTSIV